MTDVIYEVWYRGADSPPDGEKRFLTAVRTREDADERATAMNKRLAGTTVYWVAEKDVTGAFRLPPVRTPRDRYKQHIAHVETGPSTWSVTDVSITDGEDTPHDHPAVAQYRRDYPGMPPFEPFRQRNDDGTERHYALVSPHYQESAVISLETGEIVAREDRSLPKWGFCPIGFYVPDWYDVHDGSILPGSEHWSDTDEWPDGTLGFVWGCYWGDDSSWKLQVLDLSRVSEGIITRDDRFGYLEVDASGDDPRDFIRVGSAWHGNPPRVTVSSPRSYNLTTGKEFTHDD